MIVDQQTGLQMQIKRTAEFVPYSFEFTSLLQDEVISSIQAVVQSNRNNIAGSTNLSLSNYSHDSSKQAQIWVDDGTDGEYYAITVVVVTSIGAVRSSSGVIWVKDVS